MKMRLMPGPRSNLITSNTAGPRIFFASSGSCHRTQLLASPWHLLDNVAVALVQIWLQLRGCDALCKPYYDQEFAQRANDFSD